MQVGPDENLKDTALKILQNNVATVPVIHSSSDDAFFPQLLHLASLSGILKCMVFYLILWKMVDVFLVSTNQWVC